MLEVQKYLLSGHSLADLKAEFGIKSRVHSSYPHIVSLKYDQIDSPMGVRLVQECRGIIMDSRDWSVVARPFDKFFNYGEGHSTVVDWSTASVQKKEDGSLMILYFYDGKWQVGSSGTPDAGGTIDGRPVTFRELFESTWSKMGYRYPDGFEHLTFMFELVSPENRIVVRYPEPRLILIGVRDTQKGVEVPPKAFGAEYEVVQSWKLQTLDDVLATFKEMDPLKQEGYVVTDANFNRVKVKHPGYIAIHHLKEGSSPKRFLELIRSGETSEFVTHFPEYSAEIDELTKKLDDLVSHLEGVYETHKHLESQKDFALAVKGCQYPATMFTLRAKRAESVRAHLAEIPIKTLMQVLRIKVTDEAEQ